METKGPQVEQQKILLTWKADSRSFRPEENQSRTVIIVIGILVAMVLVFAQEWWLLVVLLAGAFYYWAAYKAPPEIAEFSISSRGVIGFGRLYGWEEMKKWWWETKNGRNVMVLDMTTGLVGRVFIPIQESKFEEIGKMMNKYLLFETPQETAGGKMVKWVKEKFPLENKI